MCPTYIQLIHSYSYPSMFCSEFLLHTISPLLQISLWQSIHRGSSSTQFLCGALRRRRPLILRVVSNHAGGVLPGRIPVNPVLYSRHV